MKISFHKEGIYKYVYLTLSLIGVFWLLSFFEIFQSKSIDVAFWTTIVYKLINDFWAGFLIGMFLFPLFFLIQLFYRKSALALIKVFFVIIVIIQFALVKYSLTTLLNLGADILGYSSSDIFNTVSASEAISIIYFVPFLLFSLLFFLLNIGINKYINGHILIGLSVFMILIFGSLKLTISEASDSVYQNKTSFLVSDVIRFQKEKNELSAYGLFDREDYPLLKPFDNSEDVLTPFLNVYEQKPNIVVLIVEGLGSEFVGDGDYKGFTPYLDSLILKSLYWENFLSNSGRTFGVIPSLLGSLPYGKTGFLELPNMPSHISLISVLKANGYATSYYSGDQSSFDKKINFLEYNGIDNLIDENKYGREYIKTEANEGGFSWGYPDEEIFKKTLASLENKTQPRLDIIMTLSNHEPFSFPSKEDYLEKVDSLLNSSQKFNVPKEEIRAHKEIYASLNYTDNAIKDFMSAYAKREDFNNTIFVITGDHRLIPITQKDKLCRFHVPLYIYSPMLKRPEKFKSISSHLDVTPSLLSFLMHNYKFNDLGETAWLGKGLDTARYFRNIHKIPLMRYKGNINDFVYKDYLYSDGELFKINEDFGTYKVKEEELIKRIADSLLEFKKMNIYITQRNKIFPDSLNIYVKPTVVFSKEELAIIKEVSNGLNFDQTFDIAKDKAFKKEFKVARLLCDYILNEIPNHADARTLKGRTLAWNRDFLNAENELLSVIKRTPYYDDSYMALMDLYWWSKQETKSEAIYKKAIENNIINPVVGFKMAKAYQRINDLKKADALIDSLIAIYPNNPEYLTLKKTL